MLEIEQVSHAFAAMGSEQRLEIVRLLVRAGNNGLPVNALQERLGMPGSTLTHHLKALVAAGLVTQERQGRSILNRAAFDEIRALSTFLIDQCCVDECCSDSGRTGAGSENIGESPNMAEAS